MNSTQKENAIEVDILQDFVPGVKYFVRETRLLSGMLLCRCLLNFQVILPGLQISLLIFISITKSKQNSIDKNLTLTLTFY